ncbi:MAG TPA: SIS domain-containing protein [Chloroflexota bacterium]|jgi:glucosamine--fructose-6-phosphate aminotransferase (isomerizing)
MSTTPPKGAFLRDVSEQPKAIEDTLAALTGDAALLGRLAQLRQRGGTMVLTGMGSSLAALYPTHLRLLAAGLPVVLIEAGELLHYAADRLGGQTIVMVSQSGESVEIVRLLERIGGRATVLGVTNEPDSTLARQAEITLLLRAGTEGIVATKTYVATLAALSVFVGALTGALEAELARSRRAAAALRDLIGRREAITRTLVETFGSRPRQLWTIARGPSMASAQAGSLILKEASHTAAEALTGGQFRHGPLEMVGSGHRALLFSPAGPTASIVRRLGEEIARYRGRVVLVGPADRQLPGADLPLVETDRIDDTAAPMVEIVAAELLAQAVAEARGHEPGVFRRMGKVTREE